MTSEGTQDSTFDTLVHVLTGASGSWSESLGTSALETPLSVGAGSVAAHFRVGGALVGVDTGLTSVKDVTIGTLTPVVIDCFLQHHPFKIR